MKDSRFGFLTLLTTLVLLTVEPSFGATGGSFYASQLGSATTSYGNLISGSSAGYNVQLPLSQAIDLQSGDWSQSSAVIYTATDQPSFMEWDLPSGTFDAKTVIAFRDTLFGFSSGSPWHLEVSNTVTSAWQPIGGASGAGAPSDGMLAMGNSGIMGATKLRAVYDSLNNAGGTYFASMGEILVLPDELHTVTNAYTASASSQFSGSYPASKGIDNQLGSAIPNSWFSAGGDSNAWYTLSFTSPASLNALLLSKWNNLASGYTNAIVDIYVNGTLGGGYTDGTKVAGNVDMMSPLGFGSFNVFKFDSALNGVNTLSLKFIGAGRPEDGGQGLGEIIPLTIPEPSAAMLLGLGGTLLMRRRTQQK